MNGKQLASAALMAAIVAGLAACGGDTNAPATATAPKPAATAVGMGDAMKAQADKLLADLAQYIKDNKWDLADKAVADLDGMKANLPAEYGPRIDQLKQALATAKAAAAKMPASMPAMPKMP